MSLFQINGTYYCDIGIRGKRIRKSLKTKSKKLAEAKYRLALVDAGVATNASPRLSMTDFFDRYMAHCQKQKTQKTIRADSFRARNLLLILDNLKIRSLDQISKSVIPDINRILWERNCKNSTINRYISLLKAALNWGVQSGLIDVSPLVGAHKLKEERGTHRRVFSAEEVDRLISAAPSDLYGTYLKLLHYTGARMDEMRTLECRLVNIHRGEITFEHTKSNEARIVPIDAETTQLLLSLVKPNKKYVFGDNTPAWNINVAGQTFSRIARKLGIKGSLHDFRSTFASDLLRHGTDLKTVQSLMGDKTARLVMEVYAQVIPNASRSAIDDLRKKRQLDF